MQSNVQLQQMPKTIPITEHYEITNNILGLGINGKVVECKNRTNGNKYALKVLHDNHKARREVNLHWQASGCRHIVNVVDVYENKYGDKACLLVIMEWYVHSLYAYGEFIIHFCTLITKNNHHKTALWVKLMNTTILGYASFCLNLYILWFCLLLNKQYSRIASHRHHRMYHRYTSITHLVDVWGRCTFIALLP